MMGKKQPPITDGYIRGLLCTPKLGIPILITLKVLSYQFWNRENVKFPRVIWRDLLKSHELKPSDVPPQLVEVKKLALIRKWNQVQPALSLSEWLLKWFRFENDSEKEEWQFRKLTKLFDYQIYLFVLEFAREGNLSQKVFREISDLKEIILAESK